VNNTTYHLLFIGQIPEHPVNRQTSTSDELKQAGPHFQKFLRKS